MLKRRIEVDLRVVDASPVDLTLIEFLVGRVEDIQELFVVDPAVLVSVGHGDESAEIGSGDLNIEDDEGLLELGVGEDSVLVGVAFVEELLDVDAGLLYLLSEELLEVDEFLEHLPLLVLLPPLNFQVHVRQLCARVQLIQQALHVRPDSLRRGFA